MRRENVRVGSPSKKSRAALVLLKSELAKQELADWILFREQFLNTHELKCHYCGKTGLVKDIEDMSSAAQRSILATIDHVIPISKGGKRFDVSNCVVACYKCNSKKKDNVGVAQLAERRPSKSEVVGS